MYELSHQDSFQKETTIPTELAEHFFPKHTAVATCISEAWKTGSHHPLWLHVLLYHNQLVFLCRARRLKDWPYPSLPLLLLAGASNSQSRGSMNAEDPAQLSNLALKKAVIKMTLLHINLLWVVLPAAPLSRRGRRKELPLLKQDWRRKTSKHNKNWETGKQQHFVVCGC